MIREMWEDMPIFTAFIGLIILVIIVITIDGIFSTSSYFDGVVVDKHYKASHTETGVGTAVTSTGQAATVVTTSTSPEEFLVMVKNSNGDVYTAKCNATLYYTKSIGDKIQCYISVGLISKMTWGVYGVN